jgi:hypothetical protein
LWALLTIAAIVVGAKPSSRNRRRDIEDRLAGLTGLLATLRRVVGRASACQRIALDPAPAG